MNKHLKERISITIGKEILAEIDRIRGSAPRSFVIDNLVSWALDFHPADKFLDKKGGNNKSTR